MDIVSINFQENNSSITRKAKHLDICIDAGLYHIESTISTGFEKLKFVHNALPEVSEAEVDTSMSMLGYSVSMPVFISCMTGGSDGGFAANCALAEAAQKWKIPVGLGSIRVLFEHPEVLEHFQIKRIAPDVPVLANLGAVQMRELKHADIVTLVEKLKADALVIHLNPGQELAQPEGDTNFKGLLDPITRFIRSAPFPVIVKETGFGIKPSLVYRMLEAGAAYVDIAGAGGTNWMLVESYRQNPQMPDLREDFADWGIPTAVNLASLGESTKGKVLASGGIRTASDIAKAIILGAESAGIALPLIRAYNDDSSSGVHNYLTVINRNLRIIMTLLGVKNLNELRGVSLIQDSGFKNHVDALKGF
jgi:isopentenyl-diphosphate delta-isomerase type 2